MSEWTPTNAMALLTRLGATPHLIRHHELVGEAADLLLHGLQRAVPALSIDERQVRVGARLHDAGKCEHPSEMFEPGSHHEPAGYALCRDQGVPEPIARHCVTHAAWADHPEDVEVLAVALADKLWKGKRVEALETAMIAAVSQAAGVDRWDVFTPLDDVFESIAEGGPERLERSRVEPPSR